MTKTVEVEAAMVSLHNGEAETQRKPALPPPTPDQAAPEKMIVLSVKCEVGRLWRAVMIAKNNTFLSGRDVPI